MQARAEALSLHHSGANDCRILAEAEEIGLDILLTYDADFCKRLTGRSKVVALLRPSLYWSKLAIVRGAQPITIPHHSNPLSDKTWWQS